MGHQELDGLERRCGVEQQAEGVIGSLDDLRGSTWHTVQFIMQYMTWGQYNMMGSALDGLRVIGST